MKWLVYLSMESASWWCCSCKSTRNLQELPAAGHNFCQERGLAGDFGDTNVFLTLSKNTKVINCICNNFYIRLIQ